MQSLKCLLTATRFSESRLPSYSLSSPQGMAEGTADKTRGEELHDEYRRKVWANTPSRTPNLDLPRNLLTEKQLAYSLFTNASA